MKLIKTIWYMLKVLVGASIVYIMGALTVLRYVGYSTRDLELLFLSDYLRHILHI